MKMLHKKVVAFAIIVILGIVLQYRYINEFPSYIHAWSQSDHYALALGFVDNGLNFFKPQTYVMNRQLDDGRNVESQTRTTAVDFPVHDFIPAVFMKITGSMEPWLFRLYTFIYSIAGLWFLYMVVQRYCNDDLKALLVTIFAATCPVFVYYQSGFIPGVPSLCNLIIGSYFYLKYAGSKERKDLWFAFAFITLAALARTTFVVALMAIIASQFLQIIRRKEQLKKNTIPILLSLTAVVGYYLYNSHLRQVYGSMFLNRLMMADDWHHAQTILASAWNNWGMQYFSLYHYIIACIVIGAALFYKIKTKRKIISTHHTFIQFVLIMLGGYLLFAIAMFKQFADHDYYFLDTFFVPLLLVFIISISIIPAFKMRPLWTPILILIMTTPLLGKAMDMQQHRRQAGFWDRTFATINNYAGTDVWMDSLGISRNATILAIDAYAPNIPFIQMKRKGFYVLSTTEKLIKESMKWQFDYITVQNAYMVSDIYASYPDFINQVERVGDNGKISVFKLRPSPQNTTLPEFLGLPGKEILYQDKLTFDSTTVSNWEQIKTDSTGVGKITSDESNGPAYKNEKINLSAKNNYLFFTGRFKIKSPMDFELVTSIDANGSNIYYQPFNIRSMLKDTTAWQTIHLLYCLPTTTSNNSLSFFTINNAKANLAIDDFSLVFYCNK